MTAQDLITAALKRIGALAAGETPNGDEMTDGLVRLNALIDSWANERLTVYTITRTTWTIVSGTAAYTLGVGGTINVARPEFVVDINYQDTSPTPDREYDLGPCLQPSEYASLAAKAQTGTDPLAVYYNPTYPLATVTFWPVPTSTTLQGVLYHPAAVTTFAELSTTVSLPRGYERALVANLAVELCPEFGMAVPATLEQIAMDSKAVLKVVNYRPLLMRGDPALIVGSGRTWDINADAYTRAGG